jgi:hypothetical protein
MGENQTTFQQTVCRLLWDPNFCTILNGLEELTKASLFFGYLVYEKQIFRNRFTKYEIYRQIEEMGEFAEESETSSKNN